MKKILSVIVPSYNMEAYLARALDSLMVSDSDLRDRLDVLVVNDGSRDHTSEIAHEYANRYPEIVRVVDKPNGNYGSCINAALPLAEGYYIRVLDADDTYDTLAFERYLHFVSGCAAEDDAIDLILSDYCHVDSSGRMLSYAPLGLPTEKAIGLDYISRNRVYVAMINTAFRTDLLRSMSYRQTEGVSYTDTEWRFMPMTRIRRARYIRQTVYRYLIGREGQTVSVAVSSRSYGMYMTVLRAMVAANRKEQGRIDATAQDYLDSCFFDYIRNMYSICIARVPYAELKRNFRELDAYVHSELPNLYSRFSGLWMSSLFHFNYVAFMRRNRFLIVPYAYLVRMVNRLASLKGNRSSR